MWQSSSSGINDCWLLQILPNFNAYVTPQSNIAHLKPKAMGMASFFVSNDLKVVSFREFHHNSGINLSR